MEENTEVTCIKNILKILTLGLSGTSSHKKECVVHLLLPGEPEGPGCCAILLAFASLLLCLALLPLSLFFCVKVTTEHAQQLDKYNHLFQVVKEYERAVIFRLGRLRSGGAKGPGIFFIVPCIDSYKKLDLRTVSFDVPPQEVTPIDTRPHDECILRTDLVS